MHWSILILSYISLFAMGFIDNARGPAYPLILSEFNLVPSRGSWFFTIAALGGVLSTITHRYWLEKIGPFIAIRIFIVAMALGCYGMGRASEGSFAMLLGSAFIFGFSTGGNGICMNLLTAWACPYYYRRRAFAGLHSTYALASLIAPFALTYVLESGARWDRLFAYFSIVPVALFFWSLTVRPPVKRYVHLRESSHNKWKILFGMALGFYVSAEIVASSRLVLYCTQHLSWSTAKAALYLSLFFAFLLLGRLLFASFSVKGASVTWLVISLVTTLFAFLFGLYVDPIGLSMVGMTMSIFFPCFMDWVSELFPEQGESIISSMLTSMGVMIITMHALVGYLNELWGVQVALHIGPLFCLLSLAIILKIKQVMPKP